MSGTHVGVDLIVSSPIMGNETQVWRQLGNKFGVEAARDLHRFERPKYGHHAVVYASLAVFDKFVARPGCSLLKSRYQFLNIGVS